MKLENGEPILGATILCDGINFGIYSKNATEVTLNIFEKDSSEIPICSHRLSKEKNRTGDVWHIFIGTKNVKVYYTWQIDGPKSLEEGNKFDSAIHLLDPYAKMYTKDKVSKIKKAVVIDNKIFNREIKRPSIDKRETIIYELHVSLFTSSESSKVSKLGTISGLMEKLEYLKNLGVTTIELLPVFEFDDFAVGKNCETGERLTNVWGYNPIGFFALTNKYSSIQDDTINYYEETLKEFVTLVDRVHELGMEIVLDVVYNHTAEGNGDGPIYNFKGMDNSIFYILENNKNYYTNYSGTGNTLNCNHAPVKSMIIESLRYWYCKVGVDGFRFDLGAILGRGRKGKWIGEENSLLDDIHNDMILSEVKFYAEAWDAGGGYYLNEFPKNFSVWNGKFRDCVRCFIKGDYGVVHELAQRIQGSPDIFKHKEKDIENSLNFITAHDGFTMWDLVSYNRKHNSENGEHNADGENNNHSWNHGAEGETDLKEINDLRKKQIKNMMTLLMISQGIPMISMGDEMCKTQKGNNNAYCHNSELNRVNWDKIENNREIYEFFKNIIKFRQENKILQNLKYSDLEKNISFHGVEPDKPDYSYHSHTLAVMFQSKNNKIYIAFNSYNAPLEFSLPKLEGGNWKLIMDTSFHGDSFFEEGKEIKKGKYILKEKSSIIAVFP